MTGTVTKLLPERGFGFIRDDAGEDRFFHVRDVHEGCRLVLGSRVDFDPYTARVGGKDNNLRARSVRFPV